MHKSDIRGLVKARRLQQDRQTLRPIHRQILASLTFLVPLGLLAWVGSQELRRQGERAEGALAQRAATFLKSAALQLEAHLDQEVGDLLDESTLRLLDVLPVYTVRALSDPDSTASIGPQLRDILLLDDDQQMIFPQPPPTDLGLLPQAQAPARRDAGERPTTRAVLDAAEILQVRGATEEAVLLLAELVDSRRRSATEEMYRARLELGKALRELGRTEKAAEVYDRIKYDLDLFWTEFGGPFPQASIHLLAAIGLAEVRDEPFERADLMRQISEGAYDDVADDLLHACLERLEEGIPEDDVRLRAQARDALEINRYRYDGRRFAAVYEQLLAETMRRRLARPTENVIYEVFTDDEGSWLLALRKASEDERAFLGYAWVGVRLDLALLLSEVMAPFLGPDDGGFSVAIRDRDGVPVLPKEELASDVEMQSLTTSGMVLTAVPGDLDALLLADRASVRNRALLIASLVLVALGGVFFLWRSVHRESELARLKVNLVSRVSHELKTPLSLIRLYGETLGMGRTRDQAQVAHFAGVITRESERLSNMIGRILDFSRQEAGTLHYDKERIELGRVVADVIDAYRTHVESRGASLAADLDPGLLGSADPEALQAAVLNLLENAVKYTPADAPDRTVAVTLRGAGDRAVLEVHDRGVGIPAEERARVFDSFYRASNAGEARGAGLGLGLVRHFAEAHGGTIEILGRDGGGTTARLVLPVVNNGDTDGEPS